MKDDRRIPSIARRISRAWFFRTLVLFILLDLLLLFLMHSMYSSSFPVEKDNFFLVVLAAEAGLLLIQYFAVIRKSRKLLRPLEQVAQTARERQGIESAINDLLRRTQESYREQTRFVSDASHELRTPIAVIQGYADMLSRWGKEDEKVLNEGIAAIQSESAHMKTLVEQLLFLARGDSGRNPFHPAQMDLSEMMREVYDEYCMICPDRRWRLRADLPVPILGDAAMLKQAARTLADNAVKYTDPGASITLSAAFREDVPCFAVQDNGIGIKQEDMSHIFDRFFRADPARNRATGGTGLGLSIAKWIVEKHGGYFDVFSRENFGTRISVLLPQKPLRPENAPPTSPE